MKRYRNIYQTIYSIHSVIHLLSNYLSFFSDLDTRFSLVGTTSSLRITKIQEQDGGTYQCRAENREDSLDASALIEIQVSFLRYFFTECLLFFCNVGASKIS